MTISSGASGRQRGDSAGGLQGTWLWIALPVGILALIAALWYLIIQPAGGAPPRATATPTKSPTPWPTVTVGIVVVPTRTPEPVATPTTAKPTEVSVGATVKVTGTGGAGLRLRQKPGTGSVVLKAVPDGTQLTVVGGPEQASNYTWWQVKDSSGMTGWAAADYLTLVP